MIFTTGASGGIFESDSNNATIVQNLVANPAGAALYLSGTGGNGTCHGVPLAPRARVRGFGGHSETRNVNFSRGARI